jgi:hypothetical protein
VNRHAYCNRSLFELIDTLQYLLKVITARGVVLALGVKTIRLRLLIGNNLILTDVLYCRGIEWMCRRGARSLGQWGRPARRQKEHSCAWGGNQHKNHSNSAPLKSANQVCILKVQSVSVQ